MNIVRLLKGSNPEALRQVLFPTALAGVANAVLLALVNAVAEQTAQSQPVSGRMLLLYLTAAGVYFLSYRSSLRRANALLQERLEEVRSRLVKKILHADLRVLERIGRGEIYAIVAQETNHLSQTFTLLASAVQALFLVLFCMVYIALLSQAAFVVICGFVALGLALFWARRASLNREMAKVHASEAAMVDSLMHFTEGFTEIRLNADKNDGLFRRYGRIVEQLEHAVMDIGGKWVALLLFSNAFLYALLGVVILVLPHFFQGYTDIIYKISAATIVCVGPITGATALSHIYTRADIGLGHVFRLEERLDADAPSSTGGEDATAFAGFRTITLEQVAFRYTDEAGSASFAAGPWDLTLNRGELLFMRGGNGSGKSTMLKVLSGLYRPASGRILVDGTPVTEASRPAFRELFSAIFLDFHLFDRLHGLEHVDPEQVRHLIKRLDLSHKVDFVDGRFTTQDLSTGQRKRLAMIVSMLEDREICVFDEWAADQDSRFRDVFYREILPELKARGKTVVVVTHDERYWHLCDRILTLDLGAVVADGRGG